MLTPLFKKHGFFIAMLLFGITAKSQEPKLILPFSPGIVSAIKFSPDSKKIITHVNGRRGILSSPLLWNTQTGKLLAVLSGHVEDIKEILFSPDSKKIITYTYSIAEPLRIWDAVSGKILHTITPSVKVAVFSPDSKKLATINYDSVQVWNAETGELITSLNMESTYSTNATISFSPDGKALVYANEETTAQIWDTDTGESLVMLNGQGNAINSATFSPNGEKIMTISNDTLIKVYNAITGKYLFRCGGYKESINIAKFSPDGKKIYTTTSVRPFSSDKNRIKIWSAETGSLLLNKEIRNSSTVTLDIFNDGTKILSGSMEEDNKLLIQDIQTEKVIREFKNAATISEATLSADNKKIATGSWDENVLIWNVETGALITTLNGHTLEAGSVVQSADGERIISQRDREAVQIWNTRTGALLYSIYDGNFIPGSDVLSPDGKRLLIKMIKNPSKKLKFVRPDGETAWDVHALISTYMDGTAELWKPETADIIGFLDQGERTERGKFSPDSKLLFTTTNKGITRIRNAVTGDSIFAIIQNDEEAPAGFSPDSKKIAAAVGKLIKVFNVKGTLLLTLKGHKDDVKQMVYSPDGKTIASSSKEAIIIWNAETGQVQQTIEIADDEDFVIHYSPDSKRLALRGIYILEIWDLDSKEKVSSIEKDYDLSTDNKTVVFSPDGEQFVNLWGENLIVVMNTQSAEKIVSLQGRLNEISSIIFSKDGKHLAVDYVDGIEVWNIESGERINTPGGKTFTEPINFFENNLYNNKRVSLDNGLVVVSEMQTGKKIYSFVGVDSTEFFYQLPSGYYYISSPGVSKMLHYVMPDQRVIGFEQLDVKYNRPDLVLPVIGSTDTALINSYRKAYEKRVKKLSIDTTAFRNGYSVPGADFVNRDNIEYEQKNEMLTLQIKGVDNTYKLDRFNVWVNEVPVYGQRGISIRKKNKNDFDTTFTIQLSQGENRIETSITNVNGTESYRIPQIINYTPAVKQKEMTRFIGIGIDQFADKQYNLQYSAKDIRDLSIKLKKKYGDDIIIDTLFNENVTVSNIKALKQKLQTTTENDKVIVAYSGHGMLSKEYDYYLSTYAVNFDNPEQNGLPYDELENLLDSIPARKKLMLIDACHSGEVDKEDLITLNASSDSLIKGLKPVAYKKEGHLGLKNSFELMQSLFVNVGKSTGATIISAAAGTQFALERNDLKNGVFTYSILEAMNKYPTLKISKLKKIVGERVEQLTKGLQKPTSRNETIAVDWSL